MISPVFLNCTAEIFVETITHSATTSANTKTLTPVFTTRAACDLKAVRREGGESVHFQVMTAKVFIDRPLAMGVKHWARITADVSGQIVFGQVTDVRNAGLIDDNIEFVVESTSPVPSIVS
jgi:hypothetical protein